MVSLHRFFHSSRLVDRVHVPFCFSKTVQESARLAKCVPGWPLPCFPPLPQFFEDAASRHMAAFSQKIGGEGRGEGAVFERYHPSKPSHPAYRPPSPRRGEGHLFHTANSAHKSTSLNPSRQTWRCPVRVTPFLSLSLESVH